MRKFFLVIAALLLSASAWGNPAPKALMGKWGQKIDGGADWEYTFAEKTMTFTATCGTYVEKSTVPVTYMDGGFIPDLENLDLDDRNNPNNPNSLNNPNHVWTEQDNQDSYCSALITPGFVNYSIDGDRLFFFDPQLDRSSTAWLRRSSISAILAAFNFQTTNECRAANQSCTYSGDCCSQSCQPDSTGMYAGFYCE